MTPPMPHEIQRLRHAAGLTQTEAAERVHTSLRSWQRYEKGDLPMPPAMWELAQFKIRPKKAFSARQSAD